MIMDPGILWQVRVSDEAMGGQPHSVFTHYLKTKIFDARGEQSPVVLVKK